MNFDPNTGEPINNNTNQQPVQQQDSNGIAIGGFFVAVFLSAIIGLIMSIIGLKKSKQLNGVGKGWAVGGIVVAILKIVLTIFLIVGYFFLFEALFPGFWGDVGDFMKDPTKYCSQATQCGPEVNGYRECSSITENGMNVTMSCPVDKIKIVDGKTTTTTRTTNVSDDLFGDSDKQVFANYCTKIAKDTKTQYISDSTDGDLFSSGVYVYNIKTDIDSNNVKDNVGYVIVDARNTQDIKYVINIHNSKYALNNWKVKNIDTEFFADSNFTDIEKYVDEMNDTYYKNPKLVCDNAVKAIDGNNSSTYSCFNKQGYKIN